MCEVDEIAERSQKRRGSELFFKMFRRRFLSLPLVIGAVVIGIVSGKAIFGPPLDAYWRKKLEEETAVKENDASST